MPHNSSPARPLRLVAITGLSPQVVTETIWALARRSPARLPDSITVLTSATGAEVARRTLPQAFAALGRTLGTTLPAPEIGVMLGDSGQPLADIETDRDNDAAANAIFATILAATADAGWDLHVSIAGGRKTMGCLAAIALSLCGRDRDALSHVLVDPRLQGRGDFFFPPEPPILLPLPQGGSVNTANHGLSLAEIPFVRLRGTWRADRLEGGFAAAVAAAQTMLAPPRLALVPRRGFVRCNGTEVPLPPTLIAVLLVLAERARTGLPGLRAEKEHDAALTASFREALQRCTQPVVFQAVRTAPVGIALDRAWLAEKCSRLNRALRAALGAASEPFLARTEGRRPFTSYRLTLPPDAIDILEEAP